jgi:3-dehydrotetronate 4-kinase
LLDDVEDDFTIFCSAFPKSGRKIFNGYLFVGPVLLSESGMQNHPLTPMTDPNLVRVLQGQTRHKVGLIGFDAVNRGASAIRAAMQKLRVQGVRYAIVDAPEPPGSKHEAFVKRRRSDSCQVVFVNGLAGPRSQ